MVREYGKFLASETVLCYCVIYFVCVYIVNLHLLDYDEVYTVTIPNAYGRYMYGIY